MCSMQVSSRGNETSSPCTWQAQQKFHQTLCVFNKGRTLAIFLAHHGFGRDKTISEFWAGWQEIRFCWWKDSTRRETFWVSYGLEWNGPMLLPRALTRTMVQFARELLSHLDFRGIHVSGPRLEWNEDKFAQSCCREETTSGSRASGIHASARRLVAVHMLLTRWRDGRFRLSLVARWRGSHWSRAQPGGSGGLVPDRL